MSRCCSASRVRPDHSTLWMARLVLFVLLDRTLYSLRRRLALLALRMRFPYYLATQKKAACVRQGRGAQ